jgi:hypothetical protein
MKTKRFTSFFLILFLFSGCFAPVNLGFENAELLGKKESRITANYSSYYGPVYEDPKNENDISLFKTAHVSNNFGLAYTYGISDKFNMGARYERLAITLSDIEIFGKKYDYTINEINYAEISCKINLKEKVLSLGIPVGFYFIKDKCFSVIDPRLYWTIRENNRFEFTITPKAHLLIAGGFGVMPGITCGVGLSSILDKWAFRPEIGYDGCFSFGLGLDYHLNSK